MRARRRRTGKQGGGTPIRVTCDARVPLRVPDSTPWGARGCPPTGTPSHQKADIHTLGDDFDEAWACATSTPIVLASFRFRCAG